LFTYALFGLMLFGPATGLRKLRASRWRTPPSPAEYVDALRHERLNFAPGTKWPRADPRLASGASPEILAAYVLERVSGRPWLDYIRTSIFRPANRAI
jgi:CubicO group peptidase (beta-lactamase class C family)